LPCPWIVVPTFYEKDSPAAAHACSRRAKQHHLEIMDKRAGIWNVRAKRAQLLEADNFWITLHVMCRHPIFQNLWRGAKKNTTGRNIAILQLIRVYLVKKK
jgi:hypothetical protein